MRIKFPTEALVLAYLPSQAEIEKILREVKTSSRLNLRLLFNDTHVVKIKFDGTSD